MAFESVHLSGPTDCLGRVLYSLGIGRADAELIWENTYNYDIGNDNSYCLGLERIFGDRFCHLSGVQPLIFFNAVKPKSPHVLYSVRLQDSGATKESSLNSFLKIKDIITALPYDISRPISPVDYYSFSHKNLRL